MDTFKKRTPPAYEFNSSNSLIVALNRIICLLSLSYFLSFADSLANLKSETMSKGSNAARTKTENSMRHLLGLTHAIACVIPMSTGDAEPNWMEFHFRMR